MSAQVDPELLETCHWNCKLVPAALTTKFAPDNTLCVEELGCWVIAVAVFISTAVGELAALEQPLTEVITVYAPDSDVVKVAEVDPDNAVPFLYH